MSDLLYTLILDEQVMLCVDFDRPVWFHPDNKGMRVIPQSPATITQDGVIFFGSKNLDLSTEIKEKIKAIIDEARLDQGKDFLVDLTVVETNLLSEIRENVSKSRLSGHVQVILHHENKFDFGCDVDSPCIAICQNT